MTTAFLPYRMNEIIKNKAKQIPCKSVWYWDSEETAVVICTERPGFWIGLQGNDDQQLRAELSNIFGDVVKTKYIECAG